MTLLASVQKKSREKKLLHFFRAMQPTKDDTLLVLGAGDGHDRIFAEYPWPWQITAVDHNRTSLDRLTKQCPLVVTVVADLCEPWPFQDKAFSVGYMNAVLEHVPNPTWACRELRRTCGAYWTATPHYWYPFDMHTRLPGFHWLPEGLQQSIVRSWKPGNYRDGVYERVRPVTVSQVRRWLPTATVQLGQGGYTVLAYAGEGVAP